MGYIIPDTYLNLGFTSSLRSYLLQNSKIEEIVVLPNNVFEQATVDTTLLIVQRKLNTEQFHESSVTVKLFNKKSTQINLSSPDRSFSVSTEIWYQKNAFLVNSSSSELDIVCKVEDGKDPLSRFVEAFYGIKVYQIGKGKPPQTKKIVETKPYTSVTPVDDFLPFFDGKHIGRYSLLWDRNNWLNYGQWLAEPRTPSKFEGEKILLRKIVGRTLIGTYISETSYCNTLLYVIKILPDSGFSYTYLLGILNSKLMGWYLRKRFQISEEDTFPQILLRDILSIPLKIESLERPSNLDKLVEQMLALHARRAAAHNPQELELLARQIETTDQAIDTLVYQLYGLTPEEIKLVEG